MFITGIQIEATSNGIATDFEHRNIGDELARCQRYYEKIPINISEIFLFGVNQFGSAGSIRFPFKVSKRAVPGAVSIDAASFDYYKVAGSGSNNSSSFTVSSFTTEAMEIKSAGAAANGVFWCHKVLNKRSSTNLIVLRAVICAHPVAIKGSPISSSPPRVFVCSMILVIP